jgi:hypothetical protein
MRDRRIGIGQPFLSGSQTAQKRADLSELMHEPSVLSPAAPFREPVFLRLRPVPGSGPVPAESWTALRSSTNRLCPTTLAGAALEPRLYRAEPAYPAPGSPAPCRLWPGHAARTLRLVAGVPGARRCGWLIVSRTCEGHRGEEDQKEDQEEARRRKKISSAKCRRKTPPKKMDLPTANSPPFLSRREHRLPLRALAPFRRCCWGCPFPSLLAVA